MNRTASVLLSVLLISSSALADDVLLTNGGFFDDVVVEVLDGGSVAIRLPGGALTLPSSQVARIDPGPAPLAEYEAREAALERRLAPTAVAADWLDLARWARARGFVYGARKAALQAALLDPTLEGLAALLVPLGFELDAELGRWLTHEEAMRRRGLIRLDGEWISATEYRERLTASEAAARRRREEAEEARLDRLARLTELQLLAELARAEARPQPTPAYWPGGFVSWPFFVAPGPPLLPEPPAPLSEEVTPTRPPRHSSSSREPVENRQPGSLIPLGKSSSGH